MQVALFCVPPSAFEGDSIRLKNTNSQTEYRHKNYNYKISFKC